VSEQLLLLLLPAGALNLSMKLLRWLLDVCDPARISSNASK